MSGRKLREAQAREKMAAAENAATASTSRQMTPEEQAEFERLEAEEAAKNANNTTESTDGNLDALATGLAETATDTNGSSPLAAMAAQFETQKPPAQPEVEGTEQPQQAETVQQTPAPTPPPAKAPKAEPKGKQQATDAQPITIDAATLKAMVAEAVKAELAKQLPAQKAEVKRELLKELKFDTALAELKKLAAEAVYSLADLAVHESFVKEHAEFGSQVVPMLDNILDRAIRIEDWTVEQEGLLMDVKLAAPTARVLRTIDPQQIQPAMAELKGLINEVKELIAAAKKIETGMTQQVAAYQTLAAGNQPKATNGTTHQPAAQAAPVNPFATTPTPGYG